MKIKLIIPIVVIVVVSLIIFINYAEKNTEEKYQYKFWQEEILLEDKTAVHRVFFSYSHDYGQTFSEPDDVSMTERSAYEPKMIVMDKDVILVWRDEVPGSSLLSFAISHDFGETFEKKRLFKAGRPDIVHRNDVLYLTWINYDPFQVSYAKSYDRGETFEESKLIFSPEYEWFPTRVGPVPKFSQDSGVLKINWSFDREEFEYVVED